MAKVELNEYEVQLVRFFAKFYLEQDSIAPFSEIPGFADRETFGAAFDRLVRFRYANGHSSVSLEILPSCIEAVAEWDAPPPMRDRWDEATKWFRSKPWSLPLLVFVVALPLIKGYWDLITLILGYIFPASKGGK